MPVTQVIQITVDNIDSIDSKFKIINSSIAVTKKDINLLNYLFNIHLPDNRIDVEIDFIEDIIEDVAPNMNISLVAVEKTDGKITTKTIITNVNNNSAEFVSTLLSTPRELKYNSKIFFDNNAHLDNYAIVFDKNGYFRTHAPKDGIIRDKITELGIDTYYASTRQFCEKDTYQSPVIINHYYFPKANIAIEHITTNAYSVEAISHITVIELQ
jgi:hypothetical protein